MRIEITSERYPTMIEYVPIVLVKDALLKQSQGKKLTVAETKQVRDYEQKIRNERKSAKRK